ncbi:succinate dehydrogenase assembly factor SDH5 NDAI_0B02590 [Naumovozyma dairenensis CBS 421]|uniref:Succinate dehydrogenase assembly factor 2, mitochondrial n=1 Tax=Naumovozyma dairenensis (strain ATCC 10597 / BCRC 20456 / CBS 421 / NBRC 0211 / NRRL Y-12639) TaxID=1071378 RepID=G0W683_NAUDC|nr:hypothetical protein NDAI_0B02590 [Naumovozyma dairenensis CBS 421]CCD23294.1 hypothetical protein NDAI_0B02590 [Naumovozyma dairenensis CBS 421]
MLTRNLLRCASTATVIFSRTRVLNGVLSYSFYSTNNNNNNKPNKDEDDVVSRIKIPPIDRSNEPLERTRSRLIYQSRKRGILETDLLLSAFAAKYLKDMDVVELKEYDELLNELDWDIYYWATKNFDYSPLPKKWNDSKVLKKLQEFSQNKKKEILKMPDLDKY